MMGQTMWIVLISFVAIDKWATGDEILTQEYWKGTISPEENLVLKTLPSTLQQYAIVTWAYNITIHNYSSRDPHAYVFFHQIPRTHEYFREEKNCFEPMIYVELDPRLVHLSEDNCEIQGNDLFCGGSLKQAATRDVHWEVTVGFSCNNHVLLPLDVSYNITLTAYKSITCLETKDIYEMYKLPASVKSLTKHVGTLYDKFSSWNFLGLDVDRIRKIGTLYPLLNELKPCYQHVDELILRLAFPECRNGNIVMYCTEMCDEFREACANSPLLSYTKGCKNLNTKALDEPCVYNPVKCLQEPIAPQNGFISGRGNISRGTNRTFHCNHKYALIGNDTAVCDYTGKWYIDTYPKCVHRNDSISEKEQNGSNNDFLIPLCAVGGIAFVAILIAVFLYTKCSKKFRYTVNEYPNKYCQF